MEKNEPLLKDAVETFPFLNEDKPKEKKKGKFNISVIITIVLTVIILAFVGRTLYAFYVGFKYYDLRFEEEVPLESKDEKAIDTTSAILNDTYKKYNVTSISALSVIYKTNSMDIKSLSNEEKLVILFDYLKIRCQTNASKTKEELRNAAIVLFNDETVINSLTGEDEINILNYKVKLNADGNSYNIFTDECISEGEYIDRSILKATTKEDEMYVYEKFGYFIQANEKTYNVYGDGAKNNLITTFTDSEGKRNFTNKEALKTYKFTYKKSSGNNYYLVSVIPD